MNETQREALVGRIMELGYAEEDARFATKFHEMEDESGLEQIMTKRNRGIPTTDFQFNGAISMVGTLSLFERYGIPEPNNQSSLAPQTKYYKGEMHILEYELPQSGDTMMVFVHQFCNYFREVAQRENPGQTITSPTI